MVGGLDLLFLLVSGHFLADFPLQGQYVSRMKNRHNRPEYIPEGQEYVPIWFIALTAHAFIHGLMVYLITGRLSLSVIMTATHWYIDFTKCDNIINPYQDQLLHFLIIFFIWVEVVIS